MQVHDMGRVNYGVLVAGTWGELATFGGLVEEWWWGGEGVVLGLNGQGQYLHLVAPWLGIVGWAGDSNPAPCHPHRWWVVLRRISSKVLGKLVREL